MNACGAASIPPSTTVSGRFNRPDDEQLADLGAELGRPVPVVADDVAAQRRPLAHELEHVPRPRRRLGRVVDRHRAAQGDPAEVVQRADRRLELLAADVVEVDVDAVRRQLAQRVARQTPSR